MWIQLKCYLKVYLHARFQSPASTSTVDSVAIERTVICRWILKSPVSMSLKLTFECRCRWRQDVAISMILCRIQLPLLSFLFRRFSATTFNTMTLSVMALSITMTTFVLLSHKPEQHFSKWHSAKQLKFCTPLCRLSVGLVSFGWMSLHRRIVCFLADFCFLIFEFGLTKLLEHSLLKSLLA